MRALILAAAMGLLAACQPTTPSTQTDGTRASTLPVDDADRAILDRCGAEVGLDFRGGKLQRPSQLIDVTQAERKRLTDALRACQDRERARG